MMYLDAWEIMSRHSLIPRKTSKHILKCIVDGVIPDNLALPDHVSMADVMGIRERYQEKLSKLGGKVPSGQPRNLPFYLIIKDMVPGFSWSIEEQPNLRACYDVKFNCPYVERVKPSLMSLLLNLVRADTATDLHRRYNCIYDLPQKTAERIVDLFANVNLARPSETDLQRFVAWVQKGLSGEPMTVVSPICPDYEAHHLGANIFRYSFNNLGSGVGVVAQRLQAALPQIHEVFQQIGLNVRYIVAIGDFEAFSKETCERVGLSEAEFLARLKESQQHFKKTSAVSVETPLFTDLFGGKSNWVRTKGAILARMRAGDMGRTNLTPADLKAIASSRRGLYKRWYGFDDQSSLLEILLSQGAEYCAMGEFIANGVVNGLVLGADHSRMAPFYSYHRPIPVLYLRNNYLGVQ